MLTQIQSRPNSDACPGCSCSHLGACRSFRSSSPHLPRSSSPPRCARQRGWVCRLQVEGEGQDAILMQV